MHDQVEFTKWNDKLVVNVEVMPTIYLQLTRLTHRQTDISSIHHEGFWIAKTDVESSNKFVWTSR
jgi:hypothetical protein